MSDLVGTKGGSGVWQRIISEMPEHDVYIEPFWGRGTIARLKRPAAVTIGIDRDKEAFANTRSCDAESGDVAGSDDESCGGVLQFLADGVQWVQDYFRLEGATLEPATCDRGFKLLTPLDPASLDPATGGPVATFGGIPFRRHFVYFDPPYLGYDQYYKFNLTQERHRILCRLFMRLPCPAALSGYWSDLYADELRDARVIEIPTVNRAGKKVTEVLWMNFEEPVRYHDTRFVGAGRRERERIRRRVKTWREGLARMGAAERQAVLEGCLDRN